jgi:hypothetical protein
LDGLRRENDEKIKVLFNAFFSIDSWDNGLSNGTGTRVDYRGGFL